MDVTSFLADWSAGDSRSGPRIRQARVRSVDSDPTYTITTGQAVIVPSSAQWGQSEIVANYLGEYPPRPGGSCWYVTDGVDRIILGMMAPDGPPSASIALAAATAVASSATTVITTGSVVHDPWNMAESSGTALQIPADGIYSLMAYASWGVNANGFRQVNLFRNGTTITVSRMASSPTSNPSHATLHPGFPMSKGDLVSTSVQQTTSGNLNLNLLTLSAQYVGRKRSTTSSDLLVDPGFEDNSINNPSSAWATSGAGFSISPTVVDTGSKLALRYVCSGSTNSFTTTQAYPVVPRQKYTFTVRANSTISLDPSAKLIVMLVVVAWDPLNETYSYESTINASVNFVNSGWQTYTVTGTVPAGAFLMKPWVTLTDIGETNTMSYDNLTLTEIIS